MSAYARMALLPVAVSYIVWTVGSPVHARTLPPTELESLLRELETTLGDIRSLRAPFVQERHLAIFEDVVSTTGTLYFAPPQSVRIQMDEPFESVLVTDGRAVAQFERIDGDWKRIRSGAEPVILEVTGQIAAWLQGDFAAQNEVYSLSAEVGEATRIILSPIDPDFAERIARIEVTISPDLDSVARIEIREPAGDYTALIFDEPQRNLELPVGLFQTNKLHPVPGTGTAEPSRN